MKVLRSFSNSLIQRSLEMIIYLHKMCRWRNSCLNLLFKVMKKNQTYSVKSSITLVIKNIDLKLNPESDL